MRVPDAERRSCRFVHEISCDSWKSVGRRSGQRATDRRAWRGLYMGPQAPRSARKSCAPAIADTRAACGGLRRGELRVGKRALYVAPRWHR